MFLHSAATTCVVVSLVCPSVHVSAFGEVGPALLAFCWQEMVQALHVSNRTELCRALLLLEQEPLGLMDQTLLVCCS
jgi:hypothetical protein